MTVRPSLVRSIPFWILLVGSLATGALGAWLTFSELGALTDAILGGTATPVDVYVGQTWAIVGGILIATGLVGLALTLVVAVIRSFTPVTDIEVIEGAAWSDDDEDLVDDAATVAAPVIASEPAVGTEPAAASEPVVVTEPESPADGGTAPQR